jgi:Cu/Ag efflux pump CusA
VAADHRHRALPPHRSILQIPVILGSLPLVFASGAGAASRHSIGTTVVGGMLAVTLLGVLLVPVFYVAVERLAERRRRPASPEGP